MFQALIYCLALYLFIAFTASACTKKETIVSCLTAEPAKEQLTGKFVWLDLFTHDLQSVKIFSQELFVWSFTETAPSKSQAFQKKYTKPVKL